jgi:hypothetical protein
MTDESKNEKVAKTKAPQELKPEELEKVAGGLNGEVYGQPVKGFAADGKGGAKGYQVGGTGGD